jgi:hypothetical protein
MANNSPREALPKNPEAASNKRLSRHGLSLPKAMLRALDNNGIYCFPGISVEHQHLAQRFVLKGTESGGAVENMGRYCGFLNKGGQPIPWLQPLDSFGGNGRHAIVIATELVRIEMLRIERTYELLISHHALQQHDGTPGPQLHSTILFRGRAGTLPAETLAGNSPQSGNKHAPIFHTSAGEIHAIPQKYSTAVDTVTAAVSCLRCKHTHIAVRPKPESAGSQEQQA